MHHIALDDLKVEFCKRRRKLFYDGTAVLFSAECTIGMVLGVDVAKALWQYGTMALWG